MIGISFSGWVSLSGLGILLMGCWGAGVAPFGSADQPGMDLHADEQRLWIQSQEEQARLDQSGHLYEDPVITAYVNQVAERLLPSNLQRSGFQVQVRIVRNPMLNAFAYPHGVIYVHTGILARMDNEAQLATLLGHELSHATHRHALQSVRSLKTTTATLASVGVLLVPFGTFGSLVGILGQVGGLAAVTGYSRSLEAEADQAGLDLIVKAGYDPHESPKLFEYLKQDLEEQQLDEPFFFGTHPRLVDRIHHYQEILVARYASQSGAIHQEAFLAVMRPLFLENATLDLAIGRFISAETALTRFVSRYPQDAPAHYWLGEVFRQRDGEGDQSKAIQALAKAVANNPIFADPHRSLGIIHMKRQRWHEAKIAFERYLQLSPDASDREFIQNYVEQLQNK